MNAQPVSRAALVWMALARLLAGLVLIGILLFLPAGTVRLWQAWVYMSLLFIPLVILGLVLLARDPDLLERRMRMRETQAQQKVAIAAMSFLLLAILAIPGLDKRYGWSAVPTYLVLAADVLVLVGYALFVLTIRANRYASRVIELQQDQKVITTGPYAIVRHPMYLGIILAAIGGLFIYHTWTLLFTLVAFLGLAVRARREEQALAAEFGEEWEAYCQRTPGWVPRIPRR